MTLDLKPSEFLSSFCVLPQCSVSSLEPHLRSLKKSSLFCLCRCNQDERRLLLATACRKAVGTDSVLPARSCGLEKQLPNPFLKAAIPRLSDTSQGAVLSQVQAGSASKCQTCCEWCEDLSSSAQLYWHRFFCRAALTRKSLAWKA